MNNTEEVFDERSNYILVSMWEQTPHKQKKALLWGKGDCPACVLARKYDDARKRITNLYLLSSDAKDITHCRSYQKFATWAEAASMNKEGWESSDQHWIELAEEKRDLNAPEWSVWAWLECVGSATYWRFSQQPPWDLSRQPASWKRTGARLCWEICFAVPTKLKLQGTTWIRSTSSVRMLSSGWQTIQEDSKFDWVSAWLSEYFPLILHSYALYLRQLLSIKLCGELLITH